MPSQATVIKVSRYATQIGYFGLLAVLMNWITWISPPVQIPRGFLLIVLVVPLLFPLRGLLHGKTYTHAWTSFLTMFYFTVGVDIAYNNDPDRWLALLVVLFSMLLFMGCIFYAKYEKMRVAGVGASDFLSEREPPESKQS